MSWHYIDAQQVKHIAELRGAPETSAAPRGREVGEEQDFFLPSAYRLPLPQSGQPRMGFYCFLLFFISPLSPQLPRRDPGLQEPADCKSCTQPLNWRTNTEPEKRFSGICHFGASNLKINFQSQGPRHHWRAQLLTQGPVVGLPSRGSRPEAQASA